MGFKENCKVSLRANSTTLRVTTAIDVIIVALASIAGVGCGIFGLRSTQELNQRLRKFDSSLQLFTITKNERNKCGAMAIITLAVCVGLLCFDYFVWMEILSGQHTAEQKLKATLMWYLPFYGRYIAVIGSQILYANNVLGFGRRFQRLNKILEYEFLSEQMSSSHHQLTAELRCKAKTRAHILRTLAYNYGSVSKCVEIFSNTFGFSTLCDLTSCLIHLVITAHFILLALKNPIIDRYLINLTMWMVLHIFRLLLVVEVCQMATVQSEKTKQLVAEIKRTHYERLLAVELKSFLHQLLVFEVKFSVMGIFKINRNILTAFGSAIATYLIMVTQFQNSSG
ncbi:gustatory receptor for sugar taste 43a-like [Ceratitis capitata]|uniref:gustatory receptor for sugar taste 43a-like n=1 Tax=Ceratitis capitata TaxID=7213 RepID=UPI000A0FAA97|nr:gustatory receptor for sugar taste 43a-like [Ceratitis capitata]